MTATELRALVRSAIEAHVTHKNFYSNWTKKDEVSKPTYPFVEWIDWHNKPVEDPNGILHRRQFVQLLVVTCSASNRTPDERDKAVEDADTAALEILMRIKQDRRVEVSNVNITSRWDERGYFMTGVLLQFVLEDKAGLCYDASRFSS